MSSRVDRTRLDAPIWLQDRIDESRAPLREDAIADVVVVGAGITGATTASLLAEAGLDVVLLDADRVGAGATGSSSAKASALQNLHHARMQREHGRDVADAYARATVDAVETIAEQEPSFDRRSAITWTEDSSHAEEMDAEARTLQASGLAVRVTTTAVDGLPLAHAIVLDDQGTFDPVDRVLNLVDRASRHGARIFEQSPVTKVSLAGDHRTVATPGGRIRAGHVVVATGLPILDRGGWFARTEPRRSYAMVLRAHRPPEVMSLRISGATRSARPLRLEDGSDAVLVAGGGHRTGASGDTRRHLSELAHWAREQFGAAEIVAQWSAQDWHSADGLPLVGPLWPGDDRTLAAAGFGKWGLTSGTIAAGILVRQILRQPQGAIDRALAPTRLPGRQGTINLARFTASTGLHLAKGWARLLRWGGGRTADGSVHREGAHLVATAAAPDGTRHRCLAVCTHLGGTVRWDDADGVWACPLHGSRFAADGSVLSAPALRGLRPAPEVVDGDLTLRQRSTS